MAVGSNEGGADIVSRVKIKMEMRDGKMVRFICEWQGSASAKVNLELIPHRRLLDLFLALAARVNTQRTP